MTSGHATIYMVTEDKYNNNNNNNNNNNIVISTALFTDRPGALTRTMRCKNYVR